MPFWERIDEWKAKGRVNKLLTVLDNENWAHRKRAISALGELKDQRSVEPLIALLGRESVSEVRAEVAAALGSLGDMRAVGPLLSLLNDESTDVRRRATMALGKLGDAQAVEPLIELFKETAVPHERSMALDLLGGLGGESAIKALEAALQDPARSIRRQAATILTEKILKEKSEIDRVLARVDAIEHKVVFANKLCHDCGSTLVECKKCGLLFHERESRICNTFTSPDVGFCRP